MLGSTPDRRDHQALPFEQRRYNTVTLHELTCVSAVVDGTAPTRGATGLEHCVSRAVLSGNASNDLGALDKRGSYVFAVDG